MIDPIKVVHDYTYGEPEHPVPHAEDSVHLEYEPCDASPRMIIDADGRGKATVMISVPSGDLDELVDAAQRSVLIDLDLDPKNPDDAARARADLGDQRFDELVSDTARMYLLSAALMHAKVFPAVTPVPLNREVIKRGSLAASAGSDAQAAEAAGPDGGTYAFGYAMVIRPEGKLSSFDPLDVNLPVQPQVTKAMVDARVTANVRMQLAHGDAAKAGQADVSDVNSDDPQYADMRETVRKELEDQFSRTWSNRVVSMCEHGLVDRLEDVEIPDALQQAVRDELAEDYLSRIEQRGITRSQLLKRPDFDAKKFNEQMDAQATATIRRDMALDAMADHLGLMLRAKEILESMSGGDKFPGSGEEHDRAILGHMMMTGQLPQVCQEARRFKTSDVVARQTLRHIQEAGELEMIEKLKEQQAAQTGDEQG